MYLQSAQKLVLKGFYNIIHLSDTTSYILHLSKNAFGTHLDFSARELFVLRPLDQKQDDTVFCIQKQLSGQPSSFMV